mgnify:CR=1 FL=1
MVAPLVIAGVSLLAQLGSSFLDYSAKKKTAQKQQEYYDWYQNENAKSINYELQNNIKQLQNRYFEEIEQASIENRKVAITNLQSQATAEVSALENGLDINNSSISALMNSYDREQALNDYYTAKSAKLKGYQLSQDIDSLKAKAQSAINLSIPYDSSKIVQPSVGASMLGFLGNALTTVGNTYTSMNQDKYFSTRNSNIINAIGR